MIANQSVKKPANEHVSKEVGATTQVAHTDKSKSHEENSKEGSHESVEKEEVHVVKNATEVTHPKVKHDQKPTTHAPQTNHVSDEHAEASE
jgi:transposase-like protein